MPPKSKKNEDKAAKVLTEKDTNNESVNIDKQTTDLQSSIETDSKNTKEKEIKLMTNLQIKDGKKLSPTTSLVTCVIDGEEEECVTKPLPIQQDMDQEEVYAYETLKVIITK